MAASDAGDRALNALVAALAGQERELIKSELPAVVRTIHYYERRGRLFARLCPGEPELLDALIHSIQLLKEAVGAVCLFLEGEGGLEGIRQMLVQGGLTAGSSLGALELVTADSGDSSDVWLDALTRATLLKDRELHRLALEETEGVMQGFLATARGLERLFAPHSWRESRLVPLLDTLEEIEKARSALVEVDVVQAEHVNLLRKLVARFDALELEALRHLPTLDVISGGVLRELLCSLADVYENEVPLDLLRRKHGSYISRLRQEYPGIGEAVEAFHHALHHEDVTHFPVLWDRFSSFAKTCLKAEGKAFDPDLAAVFKDYLDGKISWEDLPLFIGRAKRSVFASVSLAPDTRAVARETLVLCRAALQRPRGDHISRMQSLERRLAATELTDRK